MNRKEFLQRAAGIGVGCSTAWRGLLKGAQVASAESAEQSVTPCDKRVQQGQKVIRRLVEQLDGQLDEPARLHIMENCGKACFNGAYGPRKPQGPDREQVKGFLENLRSRFGDGAVKQEGEETVIYFKYVQNRQGLKVADGYCLCPILEDAPKDISPTYCHCSVGYVQEMFERNVGRPARVELTDSVLRGGKSCDFTVRFRL
jgi:hypothetical protein